MSAGILQRAWGRVAGRLNGASESQRKVLRNVMWAIIGKVVSMMGELFVGVLVGRYLGPEKYGLMNYVISYVIIFGIVAKFGLQSIDIRELARHPSERDTIMGTCFRMRMIFAGLAYALMAGTLVWRGEDRWTIAMILMYGLSLFMHPFDLILDYFTSIVKNEYVIKSQIFRVVAGACIKIVLLWLKQPVEWFIAAAGFDYLLLSGGYIRSYQSQVGRLRDWRFDGSRVGYYLKEAFPLLLSGAAVIIYQRIDVLMLKNMLGAAEAGYFSTAAKFLNVVLFLPTVLVQSISPILVRVRQKDPARYERMAQQMVSLVTWTAALMCLGVMASAGWVIRWTYGAKYVAAIPVLQVLIWKTTGMALATSGGQLQIIEGNQLWSFIRNLVACAVCVGANWWLIPRYGVMGSAWATLLTAAAAVFIGNAVVPSYWKVLRIQTRALFLGWLDSVQYFRDRGRARKEGKAE